MSHIEELIDKFNDLCGKSETEMGALARNELVNMQRRIVKLSGALRRIREVVSIDCRDVGETFSGLQSDIDDVLQEK